MPRDKDFKRHVRARMQKTGESYTTARKQILDKPAPRKRTSAREAAAAPSDVAQTPLPASPAPPPEPQPEPAPDYATTAGMSDDTIKAKTGRTWQEWVTTLDALGAHQLPHGRIARIVNEDHGVDGWWSQSVTVGYERIKGLREKGQRRGGSFEASKSKTFDVPVTTLFDACADPKTRKRWLTGAQYEVTTASRPKSIRVRWEDGTLVAFWFMEKGAAKSAVSVQHTKLPDRDAADRLKAYWAERLSALAELLRPR